MVFAAYLVGGLVVFPVTVLIAVTGMVFPPLPAFAYALGGTLASALLTYAIGRKTGAQPLRNLLGPRVNRVSRSEEHMSELQSLMRISYAVFCLKKKKTNTEA